MPSQTGLCVWITLLFLFFYSSSFSQATPPTDYPCDFRNYPGQTCPADCVFPANVEKGCNCFDNIDNDGDGKNNAADPDCATYFGLTFVGEGSDCSITPPGALTPFDLVGPPAVSGQNTADTQSKVAAGDVDGNGTPDIVITSKWNSEVRLVATATSTGLPAFGGDSFVAGNVIADFNADGSKQYFASCDGEAPKNLLFEHEVLIADIDGNGTAEIFAVVSNRLGSPTSPPKTFYLLALRLNEYGPGGLVPMYNAVCLGSNRPGTFGIADMDGDGKAEVYLRDRIFAAETGKLLASEGGKLMTGTGTSRWDVDVTSASVAINMDGNADGQVMELVCGAQIYKIPTITNRNPASPGTLTLWKDMNTIAFNIDGVAGNDQYFVKLMNDPAEYGIDTHSSTSVADIDKDGVVDVVLSGGVNSSTGRTAVFYWNVGDNTVTGVLTPNSAVLGIPPATSPDYNNYLNGWIWGTGRVNIGDANGDGKLDLSFIAGAQLFCVTTTAGNHLTTIWPVAAPEIKSVNVPSSNGTIPLTYRTINDTRSGVLTVTIYDFDNNGSPEMVYRDSKEIRAINGPTGLTTPFYRDCWSHTYTEGPIIADVNGDGNTDIACACNRNDGGGGFTITDGIQQQALGEVRIWYSNGEWLPTRKVWNQPGYFVVNVNDDLTLPFPQLDIATNFGNTPCPSGIPGPQTPFNVFLNQVPFLSANGCPVFPAPDLTFIGDDPNDPAYDPSDPNNFPTVFVEAPICGNLDIKVGFNVTNSGDLPINTTIPISFFAGSPYSPAPATGTLLYTTTIPVNNLQVGDTLSVGDYVNSLGQVRPGDLPFIEFDGPGTTFEMYVVLYNNGSTLPIDTLAVNSTECDITNNFWPIMVVPSPFTVNIDSLDNVKCLPTSPDKGELISHIAVGADTVIDLSPYAFQWYQSDQVTAIPGATNYNLTGLAAGDYYLVITNTQKGCSSDPILGQVVDGPLVIPGLTVSLVSDQTTCEPPNGSLQADVTGGNAGFEFSWEDAGGPIGVTGPLLENAKAGTYTVIVTETSSGCQTSADGVIGDLTQEPDVTATKVDVINCLNASSGRVSATAFFNGVAQDSAGYIFDWYFYDQVTGTRGSILPTNTGKPTIKGLPIGFYEVVITQIATGCKEANTAPDLVEIQDQTILPVVNITELAPQTSCDPLLPNGRLQATSSVAGSTFEWFVGQNTFPANLHTSVSAGGTIAENVKGGGQSYTVKVTTPNQCSAIDDEVVTEIINYPQVTLGTTPNSVCDQTLGFTGSVNVTTLTFAGNTVTLPDPNYTLKWYDGSAVLPAEERIADLNKSTITQLDSGFYTLVVENTLLHCPSIANIEQVLSIKALPAILADADSSTNCKPLVSGNGVVRVSKVDNAAIDLVNYDFRWHRGPNITGPAIGVLDDVVVDTLQGKSPNNFFTVFVRNMVSGCENTRTVEVIDAKVLPLFTLTPQPNTVCNPSLIVPAGASFTGSVTADITNEAPGGTYIFVWTDLTPEVGDPPIADTDNIISQRDSSTYQAVVTHVETGCVSNPLTADVQEITTRPVVDAVGIASTNCRPLVDGNGQVVVTDVDGITQPSGPYTFEWHRGITIAGTFLGAAPTNAAASPDTLQGKSPNNFYTVLVTNTTDGCQETETVEVVDDSVLPLLSLTSTPNTICDKTIGFDGTATATITNPIAGTYTFSWTDIFPDAGDPVITDTDGNLTQRDSSTYQVTVTHVETGCVSNPYEIDIDVDKFIPPIDIAATPNSSCVIPGNGILAATIDETTLTPPGPAAENDPLKYSIAWTDSGDPFGSLNNAVTTTTAVNGEVNQLPGNSFYTVAVERLSTGCTNTETIYLQKLIVIPVVSLNIDQQQTACTPPNGQITATVNVAPALPTQTYTFFWLKEDPFVFTNNAQNLITAVNADPASPNRRQTGAAGAVVDTHGGLMFGDYTMVVRDEFTQCLSQPVQAIIQDQTGSDITISTAGLPSQCDLFNGSLNIGAVRNDGQATTFDIELYRGGPVNTTIPIDFYTNPPVFDATENSGARPDAPWPRTASYTPPAAPTVIGALGSFIYTVVAEDGFGCKTYETYFLDFADAHKIDTLLTHSSICPYTIGNGEISVRTIAASTGAKTGANQTEFTYNFYTGGIPDPSNLITPPSPFNYPVVSTEVCNDGVDNDGDGLNNAADPDCTSRVAINNLAPGTYLVEIQENYTASQCKSYEFIEIKPDALAPIVNFVGAIRANTACDVAASADGEVSIEIDKHPNDNTSGFTYALDVFETVSLANPVTWNPATDPGPYGPYPPVGLPQAKTIGGMRPDLEYTIEVTSSNNCTTTRTVLIPNQPAVAELVDGDISIVDAFFCDPSGHVEVRSINVIGGGANPDFTNIGNYQFTWFDNAGLTPATGIFQDQGDAAVTFGGERLDSTSYATIQPGSYWVVAEKTMGTDGIGCLSAPFKADIIDRSVNPTIALAPYSNTSCTTMIFEGAISVRMADASLAGGPFTYRYDWDEVTNPIDIEGVLGSPTTGVPGNDGNGDNAPLADADSVIQLQDGVYRLTAYNEQTGCRINGQTTVLRTTVPIIIADVESRDKFFCLPSGKAIVKEVQVGGNTELNTNFDFTWREGIVTNPPLAIAAATDQLDSLSYPTITDNSLTYFVEATKRLAAGAPGAGCKSAPARIDIADRSVDPTIGLTPYANTSCTTMVFEGSISVKMDDNSIAGGPFTYRYDWDQVTNPVDIETALGAPATGVTGNDGNGLNTPLADADSVMQLQDGVYRLTAYNEITGCRVNGQTTILRTTIPIIITDVSQIDKFYCVPSGQAIVDRVQVGNNFEPNTNFDFTWREANVTNPALPVAANVDQLDSAVYSTITDNSFTYFVEVTKRLGAGAPAAGCKSAPARIDIVDRHVNPIPQLTPFANSSCGTFQNGAITILVSDSQGPGSGALYTYDWDGVNNIFDIDARDGVGGVVAGNNGNGINLPENDNDSIPNLPVGLGNTPATYQVTIINEVTECRTPASVTIEYDPVASKPNIIDVTPTLPIDCIGTGGSAEVTKITVGSGPKEYVGAELDPPAFLYDWYDNSTDAFNPTPPAGNVAPTVPNGRRVDPLAAGTYFVTVRELLTDCRSTPVQVVIDSVNVVYPHLVIFQRALQLSCDVVTGTASLKALADGEDDTNPDYTFNWFQNLDGSMPIYPPGAGVDSIGNLVEGPYSVTVTRTSTGCSSTKLFIIPALDPQFLPNIALSGDFQTSCLIDNGSVVVRVLPFPTAANGLTYPFTPSFDVDLYFGDQRGSGLDQEPAALAPDMDNIPPLPFAPPPGSFIADPLAIGKYTIRVRDINTGCIVVDTTSVIDDRRDPVPVVVVENPLTNCDTRLNGQMSATADGRPVGDYNFSWYATSNPPPGGPILSTNDKLIGVDQGNYEVLVVNKASGCDAVASGTVGFNPVFPPAPIIEIMHPQTICWEDYYPGEPLARPNGWLSASVGGEELGYRFDWYTGQFDRNQVAGLTPDTTGINNLHLTGNFGSDPGVYTVSAVILTTGCYSVTSTVLPDTRVIPQGIIETTPSFCPDVGPPGFTGSGSVALTTTNEGGGVSLREVLWFDHSNNVGVGDGLQVFNLPPGFYRAEFLSNEFCYGEAVGEVLTEIKPYNLVSSNGDNENDAWVIDCISNFTVAAGAKHDNVVKIYNRYGVLVYHAEGYNNGSIIFRGIGENGLYSMGNDLPDGTYFYVIDKRDGSKLITGFLELVR